MNKVKLSRAQIQCLKHLVSFDAPIWETDNPKRYTCDGDRLFSIKTIKALLRKRLIKPFKIPHVCKRFALTNLGKKVIDGNYTSH